MIFKVMKIKDSFCEIALNVFNALFKGCVVVVILFIVLTIWAGYSMLYTPRHYRVHKNKAFSSMIQNKVLDREYSCLSYLIGQHHYGYRVDAAELHKFKISTDDCSWSSLSNKLHIANDVEENLCTDGSLPWIISMSKIISHSGEKLISEYSFVYDRISDLYGENIETKINISVYITKNLEENLFLYVYADGILFEHETLDKMGVLEPFFYKSE